MPRMKWAKWKTPKRRRCLWSWGGHTTSELMEVKTMISRQLDWKGLPRCIVPLSIPPLINESWSPVLITSAPSRCLTYLQTLSGIRTCKADIGCDIRVLMLLKSVCPLSITLFVVAASSDVRGSYIMYLKSWRAKNQRLTMGKKVSVLHRPQFGPGRLREAATYGHLPTLVLHQSTIKLASVPCGVLSAR